MRARRGFTLVELLIGLGLGTMVGGLVMSLVVRSQRVTQSQAAVAAVHSNLRAAALILPSEVRELGYDSATIDRPDPSAPSVPLLRPDSDPDLLEMASARIRFRAMRGMGIVCRYSGNDIFVYAPWLGFRGPGVKDSFRLFVETSAELSTDDMWEAVAVTEVELGASCNGQDAIRLTVTGLESIEASRLSVGAPIRAWEHMEYGLYQSASGWSLGARSVARGETAYQPVLGPLAAGGIEFTFFDGAGNAIPAHGSTVEHRRRVRSIGLVVRGQTDEPVTLSGEGTRAVSALDLSTRVALRNTLRP